MINLTKIPTFVLVGVLCVVLFGTYEVTRHRAKMQPKSQITTVVPIPEPPKAPVAVEVKKPDPVPVEVPLSTSVEKPVVSETKPVVVEQPQLKLSTTSKSVCKSHKKKKVHSTKSNPVAPQQSKDDFFDGLFNFNSNDLGLN